MQIVDTGRKARFDKENPGYLAARYAWRAR
jgi:hypothetical protein